MKRGVVVLPSPGAGHIVSTVEFAKQIARHDPSLSITVLLIRSRVPSNKQFKFTQSSQHNLTIVELPTPTKSMIEEHTSTTSSSMPIVSHIEMHKQLVMDQLNFIAVTTKISAFIVDMFCITMAKIASSLGIASYLLFTSGAATLAYVINLPILDKKYPAFRGFAGSFDVPGISPLHARDLPESFLDKTSIPYIWFTSNAYRFAQAKGHIVNTFAEFEYKAIEALINGECNPDEGPQQVYPVGPILALDNLNDTEHSDHECIKWLDQHPDSSVVFVCFGSTGGFDHSQLREIARGLELSTHRFLWRVSIQVPSSPPREPSEEELELILPDRGFLERIKDRGLVYTKWVPQVAILAHRATGGFVSHCGWNSTLESVWFGVPIIAWPLLAEQALNAFFLVKELGLSLGLEKGDRGDVIGEELGSVVKELMEGKDGERVKENMRKAKEMARCAMKEGGSSSNYLASLVKEWTRE